jgi:hypothetical protein
LGREIALGLAKAGWQVAVHYRSSVEEALQTAADCLALLAQFQAAHPSEAGLAQLHSPHDLIFHADLADEAGTTAGGACRFDHVRRTAAAASRDHRLRVTGDVDVLEQMDDDVLDEARALAMRAQKPFRAIVNEALRRGLKALAVPEPRKPYVTEPRPLTLRSGIQIDNVQELLSLLDSEGRS